MKCPNCNVALSIADRQGIEIDYCPECRGVWLDRGELDKLIERNAAYESGRTRPLQQPWQENQPPAQPPYGAGQPPYQGGQPPYPQGPAPYPQAPPYNPPQYGAPYGRSDYDDDDYRGPDGKRHKRGGLLTELFDFD